VSAGDEMVKDCSLETSAPRSAGSVSSGLAEDEPEDSVVIWLGLVGRLEALLELDDVGLGWQVFRELRVQQPGMSSGRDRFPRAVPESGALELKPAELVDQASKVQRQPRSQLRIEPSDAIPVTMVGYRAA
jgi:hypothetical protein